MLNTSQCQKAFKTIALTTSSLSLISSGALLAMAYISPALAAAGPALEEIIVTAQKRAENIQDVPISMTVLNKSELDRRGINNLRDLDHFIPNVVQTDLDSKISGGVSIRGISSDNRNTGFDSGASMYVDGVYVGRSTAFLTDTLNIERFEILRGPQGTLFGKNTIAGAFNIITQKPANELEGYVEVQYGNYDLLRLRGSISGPIVEDKVLVSVSGYNVDRDGYQTNVVNNQDYWNENQYGGRATAVFLLSEALTATVGADGTFDNTRMNVFTVTSGLGSDCCDNDPRKISIDAPAFVDREIYGGHMTLDYALSNGGNITSISAYRNNNVEFLSDDDGTALPFLYSNFADFEDQFTQELRYVSPVDQPLKYVVGLYYYDQRTRTDRISVAPAGGFVPVDLAVTLDATIKTKSYSAYGQADWDITPELTLTAGLRYTHEKRDLTHFDLDGLVPFGIITLDTTDEISNGAFSWAAGLSYKVSEDARLYAKATRGFKSGGFNADYVGSPELAFKPEFAQSYEAGFKSEMFERRVRFNVATFYTDYKDLQVSIFNPIALSGFIVDNAAKADIWGLEIDLEAQVTDGFKLMGGLGYLDAKFDEYKDAGGSGVDYDNNRLINSPKWTASMAAQYTFDMGNSGSFFIRAEYAYRSSYFVEENNDPVSHIHGYHLLNGRIGYNSADGHWSAELWSKNLTDNLYTINQDNPIGGLFGQIANVYGPPRTYGIRLVARL